MEMNTPDSGTPLSVEEAAAKLAKFREAVGKKAEQPNEEPVEAEHEDEAPSEGNESETENDETAEGESETDDEEALMLTLPSGEQITADEAAKGYLRQSDYTRTMQRITQNDRERQARFTETIKTVESMAASVAAMKEPEPDWLALRDTLSKDEVDQYKKAWQARQGIREETEKKIKTFFETQMRERQVNTFNTLLSGEYNAEWRDQTKLGQGLRAVSEYAASNGFTADELMQADHRHFIALDKARKWDELQKSKPSAVKLVKGKPKPLPAGGKKPASQAHSTVMDRFKTSDRSISDGVRALKALARK